MVIYPHVQKLESLLPHRLESDHFVIHFGYRNPRAGRGLGGHGIRDRALALTYMGALEALYKAMTSPPWRREPPVTDEGGRTHVYVADTEPYTFHRRRVPFIVLSSRSNEPTTQAELHRAAAEAVHEAAHLFNFREHPMNDPNSYAWTWYDEGIAVLMEMIVASGNTDYFRFLMNWIDMPEVSLDDPRGKYQAGMFVRYLSRRLGVEFVNNVWTKSLPGETPLDALARLTPAGQTFISPNPDVSDIFASGYCIDPYFMWDHGCAALAPDILLRYGERAVAESLVMRRGDKETVEGRLLNHLACSYYRFYLRGGATRLTLSLYITDAPQATPLKVEVAVVTHEKRRERVEPLRPVPPPDGVVGKLSLTLGPVEPEDIDHVVLIVSNCGLRAARSQKGGPHDDKKPYVIEVAAS
jgi:hypothetical protein